MGATKVALLLMITSLIAIASSLYLARKHASNQVEIARHYIALTSLEYLAEGCSRYKDKNGGWPNSVAEIVGFRSDYEDVASRAAGYSYSLVPFNAEFGFGSLVAFDEINRKQTIEIRFPTSSNQVWNQYTRSHVPAPTLRK